MIAAQSLGQSGRSVAIGVTFPLLRIVDGGTGDADAIRQFILGDAFYQADEADSFADAGE